MSCKSSSLPPSGLHGEVGRDPRDYRVRFDKLLRLFPDFKLEFNLLTGLEELLRKYREHGFSLKDFDGSQFVRLRALKRKLPPKA